MTWFKKKTEETPSHPLDKNQEAYRKHFGIVDKYLLSVSWDENKPDAEGYIIFIDFQNDLDFVDLRSNLGPDREKQQNKFISKLQKAESCQCKHLPEEQQMDFKRMLGTGYMLAVEGNFDGIDGVIEEALLYLERRNREYSRKLFLLSGLPWALGAASAGIVLFFCDYRNPWIYGILFGILGSFVSIWTRYGKVQFTGHAQKILHFLECLSRILIGTIFGMIAMVAIKCGLILPQLSGKELIYAFIIAAFIAGFSERFIPSIVEKLTNDNQNSES